MPDLKLRYSKQRETIYQVLKEDNSHPNVDTIYMNVKKIIPDISLGTVYRNLNLLADHKQILRLDVGDGVIHYDARIDPHFHFVCDECSQIYDMMIDEDLISSFIDKVAELCHHQITSAEIIFHGVCHHCSQKNQRKEA